MENKEITEEERITRESNGKGLHHCFTNVAPWDQLTEEEREQYREVATAYLQYVRGFLETERKLDEAYRRG